MNFFLLGMPRCRSLWLSYLLSFGDSYCFHEALSQRKGLLSPTLPKIYGYDNVGSADTYPLGYNSNIVGESPLILIDRHIDDIKQSLIASFNYNDTPSNNQTMDDMYKKLKSIKTSNSMRVNFSDMNDIDCIMSIINFCGVRLDLHHIQKLMSSKIIVSNDELTLSNHALNDHI